MVTHCPPPGIIGGTHWTPRTTPLVEDDTTHAHAHALHAPAPPLQWPAALPPAADSLPVTLGSGTFTPPSPSSQRSCASTMSPSSASLTPTIGLGIGAGGSGSGAGLIAPPLSHTPSPVSMLTAASDSSVRSEKAQGGACTDGHNSTMMCAVGEAVQAAPPPRSSSKRRVSVLHIDPSEQQECVTKRAMLGERPSTVLLHTRSLYTAASAGALIGEAAPVLPADPRGFAEPTSFARKHVPVHPTPTMRAQPADTNRMVCAPLQAHSLADTAGASSAAAFAHSTAALSITIAASSSSICRILSPPSATSPSLHMGGVSLGPYTGGSGGSVFAPLPAPRPGAAKKRFKLQCPPTPMPAMCIVAGESSRELFCNKLLRRRGDTQVRTGDTSGESESTAPLHDDDDSSVDDESVVDVHASSAFIGMRTYASSPFAHTNARDGPFLFERDFQAHKSLACGGFFEVFRVEAVRTRQQERDQQAQANATLVAQRQQQREFEQFSLDLDTRSGPTTKGAAAATVGPSSLAIVPPAPAAATPPRRRVYAIKKSLRPFRSEYDRACLLRETHILALISETLLHPPAELLSLQARGIPPAVSLRPHRNPHLIRWHQTWQEAGFFFQQLEYATCTLAEFVYVLLETPPVLPALPLPHTESQAHEPDTSTSAWSIGDEAPASFFHQHLPRLFISIVAQLALALHTLHTTVCGGVVHLDLKPDNLLVNRRGTRLLLSDYGFSKQLAELAPTSASSGRGSPHAHSNRRVSNEQMEGDSVYMALELLGNCDDDADSSDDDDEGDADGAAAKSRSSGGLVGRGVATTACDMFSSGLLLFELVTNSELPKSGYLWQRLRQGFVHEYLPVFPTDEDDEERQGQGQGGVGRTRPPVASQADRGIDVQSSEAHQGGITAWMVRVISNLMAPVPSARMSASELLVAVEDKLIDLGWIDVPQGRTVTADAAAVESRAAVLAFEWTATLPPCLALPPLASLNFNALLERAREMNMPPATPTTASPSPTHSPGPHFIFPDAAAAAAAGAATTPSLSRGPSPQPCLMRQRSSPSPSRSGGFFGHKLQPRVSPVPFSSCGLPQSPWSLDSNRGSSSVTPGRMYRHIRSRSSSTGLAMLSGDPATLPRAPTPTHLLLAPNCSTPRVPRTRTVVPRSPLSAFCEAVHAPPREVRSMQPLPSVCRTFEQPWDASPPRPRAAPVASSVAPSPPASSSGGHGSGSFTKHTSVPIPRPIIIPAPQSSFPARRATFQPLSPFRLNSPARRLGDAAAPAPTVHAPAPRSVIQPQAVGGVRPAAGVVVVPLSPRLSALVGIAERDPSLPLHPVALSASSAAMPLLSSSSISTASSGVQTASAAGSAHYRALFTSSTQGIMAPSPALRPFASGVFSALSCASATSPPMSPLLSLASGGATDAHASAPATAASVSSSSSSRGGSSMFGGGVMARPAAGVSTLGAIAAGSGNGSSSVTPRSPLSIRTRPNGAPLPLLHMHMHRTLDPSHFASLLPSPVDMPGPALPDAHHWPVTIDTGTGPASSS